MIDLLNQNRNVGFSWVRMCVAQTKVLVAQPGCSWSGLIVADQPIYGFPPFHPTRGGLFLFTILSLISVVDIFDIF